VGVGLVGDPPSTIDASHGEVIDEVAAEIIVRDHYGHVL
jgi:hypothetical protein